MPRAVVSISEASCDFRVSCVIVITLKLTESCQDIVAFSSDLDKLAVADLGDGREFSLVNSRLIPISALSGFALRLPYPTLWNGFGHELIGRERVS